jgi:hypothetical protein
MKTRRHIVLGSLLLIGAIPVSLGIAFGGANAGFGKTLDTAQMAAMFGGGFVLCGDTDCDTTSGACPGGDTGCDGGSVNDCFNCSTTAGDVCGAAGGAGWMCVNGTAGCNSGSIGSCNNGMCEASTGVIDNPPPSCGTRPNC